MIPVLWIGCEPLHPCPRTLNVKALISEPNTMTSTKKILNQYIILCFVVQRFDVESSYLPLFIINYFLYNANRISNCFRVWLCMCVCVGSDDFWSSQLSSHIRIPMRFFSSLSHSSFMSCKQILFLFLSIYISLYIYIL